MERSGVEQSATPGLTAGFDAGMRALQEPIVCWKYMRARKRFHQVAVNVTDDSSARTVRLQWVDLKKSTSRSSGPKKSFDVLVFGHNYQKLPFALDVERAA